MSDDAQSVGGGQRLAETCPGCGMDGPFRGGGRFTRNRASSTLEGDGKVETWERWMRVECLDCDTVFATLEKTVRTRYTEEEKEHEVLTDGGESVSRNQHPLAVTRERQTLKRAVDAWGYDAQADMAIEECAEMIVALEHASRSDKPQTEDVLIDELADVTIMARQLRAYFGEDRVDRRITAKMDRLRDRLDQEVDDER